MPTLENLTELHVERSWSKVEAARSLRLGVDLWDKFEQGIIHAESLTCGQVARLAEGFAVGPALFLALLKQSRPQPPGVCRRWGVTHYARPAQSFALALARSGMSARDKRFWSIL